MNYRSGIYPVLFFSALHIFTGKAAAQMENDFLTPAREINARILNLDSHVDIPADFATEKMDPGIRNDKLQVDLVKMAEGGLDVAVFIAYVGQGPRDEKGFEAAFAKVKHSIASVRRLCEQMYPDRIGLALSPEETERIVASGKKAAVIGIENGYAIGRDISLLDTCYALGARYLTLCHIGHNDICDSANRLIGHPNESGEGLDERGNQVFGLIAGLETIYVEQEAPPEHGGLSEFGRQVVARMNRLGMLVDVSHISASSVRGAIAASRAPVIASHSNSRALCRIGRNLDDPELMLIRDTGGCVQVNALAGYVKFPQEARQDLQELFERTGTSKMSYEGFLRLYRENRADYDSLMTRCSEGIKQVYQRYPQPDVRDVADHIDYLVKLVGVDHVGVGTDFGGGGGVKDFKDASQAVNLTAELLRRGYSEPDLAKIWGGNFLRVWRAAEKVAKEIGR
ncbi:MAG: hypothetical protein A2Z86_08870 [Candidatus Glassbacteria bacterium GWA2_58_10]|uniref:Membrane dipeptidase n=1 Tax=Candidatus Glassbacteria bacterium GWA2_58_10 TaxID=1817865 RepID=A0A1F5YDR3_9BACT|nr:MAG: hypothetical protein A2Z86_08870 [Candidatus Glassbacteria bacterium GWA2_58_10]